MTKENRNLLINTVLVLLVSTLLLLTLVFFIPTTSADKIFGTKVKLKNKEYFRLPPTVEKIEEAYKGERLLGTVYTVKEDNNYGYVRLKVAIDDKGLIVGIGQDINQTYPEKEHSQQVFNYIESLSGSKVANPESLGLDAVAKPTTVVTLGSVNKILDTVAIHAGYKEATKPPLPGDDVVEFLREDEIDGVAVKVYKATKEYDYILGSGVLSFEFAISEDDKLIAFEELEYNHSDGDYKVRTIKYLNDLITNETDLKGVSDIDGEAGSTQSITAVKDLLKRVIAFKNGEVIEPEYVEYEGTEEVDEKTVYVYKVTKEYEYVLGSGVLSFKFKVDALGVLVAYEVVEYGHSDGDFKTRTLAYIQKLIDDKVNVKDASDIDGEANSTQSIDAVKDLLKLVAKFIDENPIEEEPEVPEDGKDVKFLRDDKVDGVDVKVYEVTGIYSYNYGDGILTFEFMIDANGLLLGYKEVAYGHTEGKFKTDALAFLDGLVTKKQNINTAKEDNKGLGDLTDGSADGSAPSTFTSRAFIDMLDKVAKFIDGVEPDPEPELDEITVEFIKNTTVNGRVLRVYAVSGELEFRKDRRAFIKYNIAIDNAGIIRQFEEVEYGHTGSYKDNVDYYLSLFVDNGVSIYSYEDFYKQALDEAVDGKVGSTFTLNSIAKMVEELKNHVLEVENSVIFLRNDVIDSTEVKVFKATKYSTFKTDKEGNSVDEEYLVFEFSIDKYGVIRGYKELYYKHTGSGFKGRVIIFLDSLIEKSIFEVESSKEDVDGISGSTNSITAIVEMLKEVRTEFIKTVDTLLLINEELVEGVKTYTYRVTKESVYRVSNTGVESKGYLSFEFTVDVKGTILDYKEVYYGHTNRDAFRLKVLAFLNQVVEARQTIFDIDQAFDDIDGSNGATFSTKAIIDIIKEIRSEIVKLLDEVEFLRSAKINGVDVDVYRVSKNLEFRDKQFAYLSFEFSIDKFGIIRGFEEIFYGHTDRYKARVIAYIEKLITEQITIYNIETSFEDVDGEAGSTFSVTAIIDMIKLVRKNIVENQEVVELMREVDGNKVYRVTKESVYVGKGTAFLSFEFKIDSNGVLKAYEILVYEHTTELGDKKFKQYVEAYLDDLIATSKKVDEIKNIEIDGGVGATNSIRAIIDMFNELHKFIEGGK